MTNAELPNTGRLPWPRRDDLDETRRALDDEIVGGPRSSSRAFVMSDPSGRLYGPFNAMLLEPQVGDALQALGTALRFRGVLDGRMREVAICEVVATLDSDFEWYAHSRVASSLGLTEAELAAIRAGDDADSLAPEEQIARRIVHSLVVNRDLDDEEYVVGAEFGLEVLADLVFLAGFYALVATVLATFQVLLPPGADEG